MPFSKSPIYNLKAVLHETGLKADVLRAWERRYGIPTPERTPGGHRLYSEFDVALLKWLLARQNEGLTISRAAEMWREQTAQGTNPLEAIAPGARAANFNVEEGYSSFEQSTTYRPETNLNVIRSHWLAACLAYNESAAEQTLNQAFSLYPIETVCIEVLQRGMAELGTLWYENRATVQQEHFASGLAMRRLDSLLSACPAPTRHETMLVGCPADEWHTFTPLLMALFLRRRGWNVIYLGANVPSNRFEETIEVIRPNLIVLAAQHLISAATLQQTALLLSARGAMVAYGGRIFSIHPAIREAIAGHYLGGNLQTALHEVENLLKTRPDAPPATSPGAEYGDVLREFVMKRPLIEALVNESAREMPASASVYMEIGNRYMGNNLIAALQLGDVNYMSSEIDWLTAMLNGLPLPPQVVPVYLSAYAQAVAAQMPAHSRPIVDWLAKHIHPN